MSLYHLAVTPVVAFLTDLSVLDSLKPNPGEVDEIFDHPLEAILSPELVETIGASETKPLSEYGSAKWPYQPQYHVNYSVLAIYVQTTELYSGRIRQTHNGCTGAGIACIDSGQLPHPSKGSLLIYLYALVSQRSMF